MPRSEGGDDFADAVARAAWYLAPFLGHEARLVLGDTAEARAALENPPTYFSHAAASRLAAARPHIEFVAADAPFHPSPNEQLLAWNVARSGDYSLRQWRAATIVDEYYSSAQTTAYLRIALGLSSAETDIAWRKRDRLERLTERRDEAWLLGPGSTLTHAPSPEPRDAALIIASLSALRNHRLSDDLSPDIVIFTDGIGVVGPSKAAQAARNELEDAARRGALLVTTEIVAASLFSLLASDIRPALIGLTLDPDADPDALRRDIQSPVPATENLLTTLGLPLAAALGETIKLAGFDGPAPASETGQDEFAAWPHEAAAKQLEREAELRLVHPLCGFQTSNHYYDAHLFRLSRDLQQLDERGLDVSPMTPTRIGPLNGEFISASPSQPSRLARLGVYAFLEALDAHPRVTTICSASLASLVAISLFLVLGPDPMTAILICGVFAFASVAAIGAVWFSLRARMTRSIDACRREALLRMAESARYTNARLDALKAQLAQIAPERAETTDTDQPPS